MCNHEVEIVVIGKMNLVCKYSPLYVQAEEVNPGIECLWMEEILTYDVQNDGSHASIHMNTKVGTPCR
jgi:hypothetical protein